MKGVVLSLAAAADLDAIDDYTVEHFGLRQAIETAAAIEAALTLLARFPRSGRVCEEYNPPGRAFRFRVVLRSIVIVYEPAKDGIRVARFIAAVRHLPAELERDSGDDA